MYNGIIRACIQLFFPMLLMAFYGLRNGKLWMPIVQIFFFIIFFVVTLTHIELNKDKVDSKEYKNKYGSYFTNVETYRKPRALHYTTLFLLRRLFIALVIVYLRFSVVMQVLLAVHSSLLMLTWLIQVRPMESDSKNYLEMANEFLICVLGYFGFLFTDFVGDPGTKYMFGYAYIGILCFGLLGNLVVLGIDTVKEFKIYKAYYKKQIMYYCSFLKRKPKQTEA
jgi:hypothetical protein